MHRRPGIASGVHLLARFARAASDQPEPKVQVYLPRHGGYTEAVVRGLDAAKDTVLVQACSFMSAPTAKALVAAGAA